MLLTECLEEQSLNFGGLWCQVPRVPSSCNGLAQASFCLDFPYLKHVGEIFHI